MDSFFTDRRQTKRRTHLVEGNFITAIGLLHFLVADLVRLDEHFFAFITLVAVQSVLEAIPGEVLPLLRLQVASTQAISNVGLLFFGLFELLDAERENSFSMMTRRAGRF